MQASTFTVVETYIDYVEVSLNEGENTIEIPAGKYATTNVFAMGEYTMSWTGNVTVTLNGVEVENGAVVTFNHPMMNPNLVEIVPADGEACTVVLTIEAVIPPVVELVFGENAVNVTVDNYYCAGTEASFTAAEAGKYVLNAAAGEENAAIGVLDAYGIEWVSLPYTF